MAASKRLFLIDGSALAYRSYFAFVRNPLINRKGMNTSAVFGFTNSLLKLIETEKPDYIAVVFDSPEPTFRHRMYPEYKATREKMPDDMAAQLPYVDQVVKAFNIPQIVRPGVEADDIIGTLATRAAREGLEAFMVSGDKDFLQLVTDKVKVYNNTKKGDETEILDPAGVEAKFGVPPAQVVDVLGLMGDTSDNIPGVEGVGEKSAVELVKRFGSLEAALDHADEVTAKRVREGLKKGREDALKSKKLVTIDTNVPLDVKLEDLRPGQPDSAELVRLFQFFEFDSLIDRIRVAQSPHEVTYHLVNDEKAFSHLLDLLKAADSFVFDLETTSLNPIDAEIVGLSFAVREREAFYVPVSPARTAAASTGLFDAPESSLDRVIERLKPIFESETPRKGGQNVKYDMLVLRNYGIEVRGLAFDTMVASYLLDPSQRQHGLDFLSLKHLNFQKIPTSDLIGSGKTQISMRDVPVEKVASYACEDADITLRLNNLFAPWLHEYGLDKLYREVEMPLVTVLMKMEANGVRLDLELLRQMSAELGQRLEALEGEIFVLAGESFNLNSPQQLGKILFEKLQVHHKTSVRVRRTKTGYSTDSAVLEAMTGQPLVDKILEYRSLYKLKNTYLDALPKLVSRRTGKIHTSFNQAVTATGRLSSSDPNLQNIPIRTELGRQIRKAFITEDDEHVLLSADYSQIELRILAHMSDDERLIQTFVDGEDVHRRTASLIFGVPLDQVKPDMRDRAKAINFGIIYGMGPQRLAQESGSPTGERISMDEAKQFIDAYFRNYPGIKKFTDAMVQQARTEGFVTTLLGRRRNLLEIHSTNRGMAVAAERMAVNTPIQGSAADMIKVAMVHIDRRLDRERCRARMILQVHDELVFEVHKGEVGRAREIVREEMERAIPLKVPVKVDVSVGQNWLEAH